MEPVRNDTTTDRRTAVELAKRLLVDSIWRTAKIEVDGVTFPDTPEIEERMSRTNLILEEYETGVLDETEAGEQLFNHLFGSGLGRGNN